MGAQHVSVLKAMGLPEDRINAIEGMKEEDVKAYDPKDDIAAVRGVISSSLLEDADFLGKIPEDKVPQSVLKKVESGQYARFLNESKEVAKLMQVDLSDLTAEEQKSLKTVLTKTLTKYGEKVGKDSSVKDLQEQLILANSKVKELGENHTKALEQKEGETATKYTGRITRLVVSSELRGLEGIELTVPPSYLMDTVMKKLSSKYVLELDELDGVRLMQKENPKLAAMNADKTAELTLSDALREIVLADKVGKEVKKKDDKNNPKEVIIGDDNESGISSNVSDKINAKIKAEGGGK